MVHEMSLHNRFSRKSASVRQNERNYKLSWNHVEYQITMIKSSRAAAVL